MAVVEKGRCIVELDRDTGRPIRIFANVRAAAASEAWDRGDTREMLEAIATAEIRLQVYDRSGRECERCAKPLTWDSMHMNERVHRGQGGEVSVANGEALCYECHLGVFGEHGARRPQFTKATTDEST